MIRIALFLLILATANYSQAYEWEYVGMDGVPTTTIMVDNQNSRVFVGTNEGFHFFDIQSGSWTERDDEGQTDRKVTLIRKRISSDQGIYIGRVNSSNNGYLELSDNLGIDFTVVYQSEGGPFLDLKEFGQDIFACSSADINSGELVLSTNGGTNWFPVYGHGHTSMTSLSMGPDFSGVCVAGDNGISMTLDNGINWGPVGENLPEGEMVRSMEVFHPGGCVITSWAVASTQDTVYQSTSEASGQFYFQPVISTGFLGTTTFFIPLGGIFYATGMAAVTNDGRLLVSSNAGTSWEDETGNLPGQPIAMEFCTVDNGLYVCTLNHGVFRRQHVVTAVEQDFPNQSQVMLKAWPNPFNPRVNLSFEMASAGPVELEIFDTRGRTVAIVHKGWMDAGTHQLSWDARGAASGVYLAQIATSQEKQTTRLILVR